MSVVVLLRHAKSEWPASMGDAARPLGPRGERDAAAVGRWLARHVPGIDVALVSPAERAQRTWALAAAELGEVPQWRTVPLLYHQGAEAIVDAIAGESGQNVLVVGHNPSLEDVVEILTGRRITLKTSSLAVLNLVEGSARAELTLVETVRG